MPNYEFSIYYITDEGTAQSLYDKTDDTRPLEFTNLIKAMEYIQRVFNTLDFDLNQAKTSADLKINDHLHIIINEVGAA